jgi:hypothetical protein
MRILEKCLKFDHSHFLRFNFTRRLNAPQNLRIVQHNAQHWTPLKQWPNAFILNNNSRGCINRKHMYPFIKTACTDMTMVACGLRKRECTALHPQTVAFVTHLWGVPATLWCRSAQSANTNYISCVYSSEDLRRIFLLS